MEDRRAGYVFYTIFRKGMNYIKGQPPGRIIAMGFAFVILTGSFLLMLPCSVREGAQVSFIDALLPLPAQYV